MPTISIQRLLNPRSVAIIGASDNVRAVGGLVLDNLLRFGYPGTIHAVNPKRDSVRDIVCAPSIEALPDGIDCAIFAVPAPEIVNAIPVCGRKGFGSAVVFASGFAEAGEAGEQMQRAFEAACRASGMAVAGPNCMGLTNYADGIPLTFESVVPQSVAVERGVSIVAQSGAMANNVRDAMVGRGIPLVYSASTGNEAVIGLEDFIEAYLADERTAVIAVYAEQIRHPRRFLALAARARLLAKPIVLMLVGRSEAAKKAAKSHTGALSGDYETAAALLRHEGVVVCDTTDEQFDVLPLLRRHPIPQDKGLAFVTGSGAMKNIALDLGASLGLEFPPLAPETVARLKPVLPDFAEIENPLDYTTIAVKDPSLMGVVIDAVAQDPNSGLLVVAQMGGSPLNQSDKAQYMVPATARADKPAAQVIMGDGFSLEPSLIEAVERTQVPFYRSPERALRAMAHIARMAKALRWHRECGVQARQTWQLPAIKPGTLAEYEGKKILAAMGIPVPRSRLVQTVQEAQEAARSLGYPVVIKIQSRDIPHKSDVGGVQVNIRDDESMALAWERMMERVLAAKPGAAINGVLIEKMGAPGLELVVGARRDAQWGPVVLIGLGGIWIEVLKDVRLLSAHADVPKIIEEMRLLKAAKVFEGLRGNPPIDVEAVAAVAAKVGQLMLEQPALAEVDVNPLIAYSSGVLALDALLVYESAEV